MSDDVTLKFAADLEDVKRSLDDMNENINGWANKFKQAIADNVVGGIINLFEGMFGLIKKGFEEVIDFFKESLDVGTERELTFTRLEQTISHVRGGFALSAQQIRDWADQLEGATGVADDAIERVAASLIRFHVGGDTFRQAVTAAMDISALTGGSMEAEASKIGRALAGLEQGQAGGIRRLREELADLTEAEKKHIEELAKTGHGHEAVILVMEELNRKYHDGAEIIGNTLHGQMQRLHAIIGNVYEEIGDKLVPIMKEMTPVAIELAHEIERIAKAAGEWIQGMASSSTAKEGISAITESVRKLFFEAEEFFKRAPQMLNIIWANLQRGFADLRVAIDQILASLPRMIFGGVVTDANKRLGADMTPEEAAMVGRVRATKGDAASAEYANSLGATSWGGQIAAQGEQVKAGTFADLFKNFWGDVDADLKRSGEAEQKRREELEKSTEALKKAAEEEQKYKDRWVPKQSIGGDIAKFDFDGGFAPDSMLGRMQGALQSGLGAFNAAGQAAQDADKEKFFAPFVLDDKMKEIQRQMKELDKGPAPFKSAIENASSVFSRIQVGAASEEENTAKEALKAQLELLQTQKEKLQTDKEHQTRQEAWLKHIAEKNEKPRAA